MTSSLLGLSGVLFAVRLNRRLYLGDERVRRAVQAPCEGMQGDMAHQAGIGDMQPLQKVTFRNMVDSGDVGDRHPGANAAHISAERRLTTLLEALHALHRLHDAENRQAQRKTQEDAYANQLQAHIQRQLFLLQTTRSPGVRS